MKKILLAIVFLFILGVLGCIPEKIEIPNANIPSEDVPGKDLSDVPRFEPSIRYRYDEESWAGGLKTIFISYYAFANASEVRQFYLAKMPEFGWNFYGEEGNELRYSKDPECESYGPSCWPRVEIRIWKTGKENLTNLEIVYYQSS